MSSHVKPYRIWRNTIREPHPIIWSATTQLERSRETQISNGPNILFVIYAGRSGESSSYMTLYWTITTVFSVWDTKYAGVKRRNELILPGKVQVRFGGTAKYKSSFKDWCWVGGHQVVQFCRFGSRQSYRYWLLWIQTSRHQATWFQVLGNQVTLCVRNQAWPQTEVEASGRRTSHLCTDRFLYLFLPGKIY